MEQEKDEFETPVQLKHEWSNEDGFENTVLGTFTSRKALGLYLVGMMEKKQELDRSALNDLFLRKIKINPAPNEPDVYYIYDCNNNLKNTNDTSYDLK